MVFAKGENLEKRHLGKVRQPVFNLEIVESGSNVPSDILNWVISKMVWVKLL